uniref:Nuclear factor of activated T-cells 5 n=1 Tax=Knipowitschia caucasica TaxID=637954 RepID=A0AAV2KQA9_KNICA
MGSRVFGVVVVVCVVRMRRAAGGLCWDVGGAVGQVCVCVSLSTSVCPSPQPEPRGWRLDSGLTCLLALQSSDIDLNSPKSLYSKESVYDLLPKELQLQPSSAQTEPASMSQQSGGEAGPPPLAALASDATSSTCSPSTSSSLAAPCSGPSSELLNIPKHMHSEGAMEDSMSGSSQPNSSGSTTAVDMGSGTSGLGVQQAQNTPSKRRPALSISPPPEDLFDDSQMSCQDEPTGSGPPPPESEHSSSMWADDSLSNFSLLSTVSYNDNNEVPRKSRKRTPRQRPGPKATAPEDSMDVFDADSAKAPHFVLSQLGSDKNSGLEPGSAVKSGLLCGQFPSRSDGKELKILVQPETQHRARYLTEGSRGSVKDRTQQGFPTIKLEGVNEAVTLQIFVANDTGRVKPHGFYQACKVTGRNTTVCTEVDIEGTTVIEVPLEPSNEMTLAVDCVGILKLRNADVEARIGVAGSKKKSTRARLAFRVTIPQPDGSVLTLQVPSSPILCTQPAGVPEILKKSLHSCSVKGEEEVFIIGKNFLKGTKVIFKENITDENSWQAEGKVDMDFFHQNHLIVTVPPFHNQSITSPVSVGIFVMTNAGRSHEAQSFTYSPDPVDNTIQTVKTEGTSLVKTCIFDEQIKTMSSDQTEGSRPMSKQEVTPMEVSSLPSSDVFKPSSDTLSSVQQSLDLSSSTLPVSESFQTPMPLQPEDVDLPTAPAVFSSLDSLSAIQKQDIASSTAPFPVSGDTSIPPVTPEVPQQFLRDPQESPASETANNSGGVVVMALPQMAAPTQPQSQVSMFVQDGVAQLEQAVRELQSGNSSTLQQVLEAAVAQQQQLNSVLYSPTPSAESLQQHVQENMNSLCLGTNDGPMSTQQHLHLQQQHFQQQQVLGNMQMQQQQLLLQPQEQINLQQSQGQVLNNMQLQDQQQQTQILNNLQMQQQQMMDNIQSPNSTQVLGNMQVQTQQQSQILNNLQMQQQQQILDNIHQQSTILGSMQIQDQQQQTQILSSLQMQQQQQTQVLNNLQQQQQVLENLQQQLQAELLQPQVQQPVSLLQQAGELLTIQTSFPSQPPSHSSPPQQLFQSPCPLAETQGNQQQVLLQNTINALTDTTEPMSFQDGSSGSNSASTGSRQANLFQEQQPMQVVSGSNVQNSQPVDLFLPSASMSNLQSTLGAQELTNQATNSGTTIFLVQSAVGVVGNPGQHPPEQLFQTNITGNVTSQGQANVFVFGIQNDSQLLSSSGSSLPAQNQAQTATHMQSLLDQTMGQAPPSNPPSLHSGLQNSLEIMFESSTDVSKHSVPLG